MLRIPLRGTRLRRAVDPGDLCQPSGPDGEGQAEGQARTRAANLAPNEGDCAGQAGKIADHIVVALLGVGQGEAGMDLQAGKVADAAFPPVERGVLLTLSSASARLLMQPLH